MIIFEPIAIFSSWLDLHTVINANTRWSPNSVTVAGHEAKGNQLNRLNDASDFDIDDDGTLYIADCENHRIVAWKAGATRGDVVAGGNGQGNGLNQLNQPKVVLVDRVHDSLVVSDTGNRRVMRWSLQGNSPIGEVFIENTVSLGLAMVDGGSLYVSDYEKHEVRRYDEEEREGVIVAGGHGQGGALNQLNYPRHLFVDRDLSVYISDRDNHRVIKWLKDEERRLSLLLAAIGQGNALNQLNSPAGIFVDSMGFDLRRVDQSNSRIMCWRSTQQTMESFCWVKKSRICTEEPSGAWFSTEMGICICPNIRVIESNGMLIACNRIR